MITFKQLQAFYSAAVSTSFQVASERLHITQSSLSKRVAELESELRKPLFDRTGHRATLTEAGELLLPLAQRVLGLTDEIVSVLADESAIRGRCRFGVGELAALTWLPRFVNYVNVHHPDLSLEPNVDVGFNLENQLDEGELDFAVIAGYSTRNEMVSVPIGSIPMQWAAASEVAGGVQQINAELLERVAVISMPARSSSTRSLERWLSTNGLVTHRRMYCNNLSAIASLVASGVGVGALPAHWIQRLQSRSSVIALEATPNLFDLEYTFQRRQDDSRPLIAAMRQAVLATADFDTPNSLW